MAFTVHATLRGADKQYLGHPNLLKNPGFENGLSGWSSASGTFATDTTTFYEGKAGGKVSTVADTFNLIQTIQTENHEGKTFGVECMLQSASSTNVAVCALVDGAEQNCTNFESASGTSFTKYKMFGVVSATGTIGISVKTESAVTDTVSIDSCNLNFNPFIYADLLNEQFINHSSNTAINGNAEVELTIANFSATGTNLLSLEDDTANTRTKFIAQRSITITNFSFSGVNTLTNGTFQILKNGSTIVSESQMVQGVNVRTSLTAPVGLLSGEFLTIKAITGDLRTTIDPIYINIHAQAQTRHVVNHQDKGVDVVVEGSGNDGTAITANVTDINWTETKDTHSAWSGTQFTAPEAGIYNFAGAIALTSGTLSQIKAYKGGVQLTWMGYSATASSNHTFQGTLNLNKNDVISIRSSGGATLSNSSDHTLNITKQAAGNIHAVPVTNLVKNVFSAKITNGGTCAILTQSSSFIQSCSRTAAGRVTITFVSGFFTVAPSIALSVGEQDPTDANAIDYLNLTSSSVDTVITDVAGTGTNQDSDFSITVTRQSTDYKAPQGVYLGRLTYPQTAYIKDLKTSATGGGSASANTLVTRTLNTLSGDTSFVSLSSNQFTLQPGEYIVHAAVPAYRTSQTQAFLYNVTDAVYVIDGQSGASGATASTGVLFMVDGYLSIGSAKTYEIRMFTTAAFATNGLGAPSDSHANNPQATEVYTTVKLIKVR